MGDEKEQKVSQPDENGKNTNNDFMNQMMNMQMMNEMMNQAARRNINENTKKKIVFPDDIILVFRNDDDDTDNIIMASNKIRKYIKNLDFEALGKIKKYYKPSWKDWFGWHQEAVPYGDAEEDKKAIDNLKYTHSLMKNSIEGVSITESAFEKIVNKFICDFLEIPNIFDKHLILDEAHQLEYNDSSSDEPVINSNNQETGRDVRPANISASQLEVASESTNTNIPLFGNTAVYKGMNNMLYADGKVGKSLFSIEIAKNDAIKKPLFILLEDYGNKQAERYSRALKHKRLKVINLQDWDTTFKQSEAERKNQALFATFMNTVIKYHNFKKLYKENCKDYGIDTANKKLKNIDILEKVIENELAKDNEIDFICVDSLLALAGNVASINRTFVERIIKRPSDRYITFLLIHHTNSKGDPAGPDDIENPFDYIYKLSIDNQSGNETILIMEEKARFTDPKEIKIKRIVEEGGILASHQVIETSFDVSEKKDNQNTLEKIIAILKTFDTSEISHVELWNIVKEKNICAEETFNNKLTKLKKEGCIEMKNGKNWQDGIIIKKKKA